MYGTLFFSSDPSNILVCVGVSKIIVKVKLCAQPMHQIYVIKYCILRKTTSSE